MISWKSIPVYIASTFSDMHAERDWLMHHVFPELDGRLKERACTLETVDLRWGVDTTLFPDHESKAHTVLKVCLEEIDRCRPLFLGLLGDRYGWIPPATITSRFMGALSTEIHPEQLSVTALEIEFAIQDNELARHSLFFFRQPLPVEKMSPAAIARYRDTETDSPDIGSENLNILKERLRKKFPDRVRDYSLDWDQKSEHMSGLQEWGDTVTELLWMEIDKRTADRVKPTQTSWQAGDSLALAEFVGLQVRDNIGRDDVLSRLCNIALGLDGSDGAGCLLVGDGGSGKSNIFGRLHASLKNEDILLLAHAAGINGSSISLERMLLRWIGELASYLEIPETGLDLSSAKKVEEIFGELLAQASFEGKVALLVDGLDEFETSVRSKYLAWLPSHWPANVRFIGTTSAVEPGTASFVDSPLDTLQLRPLTRNESTEIVLATGRRYHRDVPLEVMDALLDLDDGTFKPGAGNPLWLSLASTELNLLAEDDYRSADSYSESSAENRLVRLLVNKATEQVGPMEEMYQRLLDRIDGYLEPESVTVFSSLLAISRSGLSESDLKKLWPRITGHPLSALAFARLRRAFRGHLSARGPEARWLFVHSQARQAIEKRSLEAGKDLSHFHGIMAEYLDRQEPGHGLRASELMHHLLMSDNLEGAAQYFASAQTDEELNGSVDALCGQILGLEAREAGSSKTWLENWISLATKSPDFMGALCGRVSRNLFKDLEFRIPSAILQDLLSTVQTQLVALIQNNNSHSEWEIVLAEILEHSGSLYLGSGDTGLALSTNGRATLVRKSHLDDNPKDQVFRMNLGFALLRQVWTLLETDAVQQSLEVLDEIKEHIAILEDTASNTKEGVQLAALYHLRSGEAFARLGRSDAAKDSLQTCLELLELLVASVEIEDSEVQQNLSVVFFKLGDLLRAIGDVTSSKDLFKRFGRIAQNLSRVHPGNLLWQRGMLISQGMLALVEDEQGSSAEAIRTFAKISSGYQHLLNIDPKNTLYRSDLANIKAWHGESLLRSNRTAEACTLLQEASNISGEIVALDESHLGLLRQHLEIRTNLAMAQAQAEDFSQAILDSEATLVWAQRLVDGNYADTSLREHLVSAYHTFGSVLRESGDREAAWSQFENAYDILEDLIDSGSESPRIMRNFASCARILGDFCIHENNYDTALDYYQGALNKCLASEMVFGDDRNARRDLAISYISAARALAYCHEIAESRNGFSCGLAILETLVAENPQEYALKRDLAISYHHRALALREANSHSRYRDDTQRCHDIFTSMQRMGMELDPPSRALLQRIQIEKGE